MRMRVTVIALACSFAASIAVADQPVPVLPVDQAPVVRSIPDGPDTALSQAPNQVHGLVSDLGCDICGPGLQILGDNLVVSTGGLGYEPDEITIWGGFYPTDTPVPVTFDVFFHADAGGVPDPTSTCFATGIAPTSDTPTGVTILGISEREIVLNISGCTLADGTYWLVLYTDTGLGTDDFLWEYGNVDPTNGIPGRVWSNTNPPTPWNQDPPSDLAVLITGTILPVELQSFSIE